MKESTLLYNTVFVGEHIMCASTSGNSQSLDAAATTGDHYDHTTVVESDSGKGSSSTCRLNLL